MAEKSKDIAEQYAEAMDSIAPIYNREGERIKFLEWCRLNTENPDYARVALDMLHDKGDEIQISTVLLGIVYQSSFSQSENDRPLMFETMVFRKDSNYAHRYGSLKEAEEGHKTIVEALKAGRPLPFDDESLDAKMATLGTLLGHKLVL